jgi:hypothetical protein
VAVDFLPRRTLALSGLGQHIGDGNQSVSAGGSDWVQLVGSDKANQQLGDVIYKGRIGHAKPGLEGVLGETREEATGC